MRQSRDMKLLHVRRIRARLYDVCDISDARLRNMYIYILHTVANAVADKITIIVLAMNVLK